MKKIGFIGLGIMGNPMCKNLLKAGYQLIVFDVNCAAVAEMAAAGGLPAGSPAEVAAQVDVIITMLPNAPEVKQVALGPSGIIAGARPGTIMIDMSSVAPSANREIAAGLAEKGVGMLDAPVSGGEPGAVKGTLSIMVGGPEDLFASCRDILQAMGTSVVLVGGLGSGNVAKLANQVIVALNIAAVSEALVLAAKAGVDPEAVYRAIRGGLAGSNVLDAKAPQMLAGNVDPGFRIKLHVKDLLNALTTGHEVGAPLPLTAVAMEILQSLMAEGMEEADHSAMVRFYERLARTEVRRR
jgi:2-hydroxy-3-oxopropionate reductase